MDLIGDVAALCPCWIVMADGARHRCIRPVGLSGDSSEPAYDFDGPTAPGTVRWREIAAFENIADPRRRLARPWP